jgi:hypothetical protein
MKKISAALSQTLRVTTALALFASSGAVWAQTAEPSKTEPVAATEESVKGEDPVKADEPAKAEANRPLKPYAGRIRTFAGDVSGTAGRIRTFEGNVAGSAGRIRTFAGNLASFAGRIRTFQGETLPAVGTNTAFWGKLVAVSGSVIPEAGRIRTFAGALEGSAGRIRTFAETLRAPDGSLLSYDKATTAYNNIAAQIAEIVKLSKGTFGAAIEAQTGQSFDEAFAKRLLEKYGINLNDPRSLDGMNEVDLELFLIDWNDNLMNYSGYNQVDHWMKTINWSPSLTQDVQGGYKANIGILDFTLTGAETANIVEAAGISTVTNGHGSAVAGLIVGAHDGQGVMGIAPEAKVFTYNPFDETFTAGWDDIRTGIRMFVDNKVSVVNVSLGVPGWTLNDGWNEIFRDPEFSRNSLRQLFVFAAGNDGVVQPRDIEWSAVSNPVSIVVGSVDPFGNISSFSNTPGTTCLLTNGVCNSSADLLMNRFIVAPGEFILVSDGQGGVTRMSGTSFAAPLVSGTLALIADRWPWMAWKPEEIADLILSTATDLGAPGTDPVYGRGLLNVLGALSPVNFDSLSYMVAENGQFKNYTASSIVPAAVTNKATWNASGAYLSLIEKHGSTFRDFLVPLSTKLSGQSLGLTGIQFQDYMANRFWSWIASKSAPTGTTSKTGSTTKKKKFTQDHIASPLLGFGQIRAEMTLQPRALRSGFRQSEIPFETALSLSTNNNRVGFQFGTGNGAVVLGGNSAFGLNSDYDVDTGGANPFLALASGSGYLSTRFAVNEQLTVAVGYTEQRLESDLRGVPSKIFQAMAQLQPYQASANTVTVTYKPSEWLTATANYTHLREQASLLGVRSSGVNDFSDGNVTDAATYGMDVEITPSLSVGASATIGHTRSVENTTQNLVVSDDGVISTAFQFAIDKAHVFDKNDSARFTLSQPLHIESGTLDFNSVQVVDRQTGELGVTTQTISLNSIKRSYVAEAIYKRSVLDGKAEFNLFGRARIGDEFANRQNAALAVGAGFQIAF